MRIVLLLLIRAYQRWLSPRKGFCCAYRQHTGAASCSHLGYRSVRRYGVLRGLLVLDQRLARCGLAHQRLQALRQQHTVAALRPPIAQRGDCDVGVCDAGLCEVLPNGSACDWDGDGRSCEWADCNCPCDASCDWPREPRKQERDHDGSIMTHLPNWRRI